MKEALLALAIYVIAVGVAVLVQAAVTSAGFRLDYWPFVAGLLLLVVIWIGLRLLSEMERTHQQNVDMSALRARERLPVGTFQKPPLQSTLASRRHPERI